MAIRTARAVGLAALVLAAALAVGLPADRPGTAAAAQPTKIEGCVNIQEPGVYELETDITGGGGGGNFTFISETCIRIGASDVVLRGQGHLIDGIGISDTTAVGATSRTPLHNVTVTNLRTTDWNRGVYLNNTVDAEVRNVETAGTSYGVFVEHSRGTAIRNVNVDGAFIGVYLGDTEETTLADNEYAGTHVGGVVRG
jgi:nitrous oxidase accessory protein NosD